MSQFSFSSSHMRFSRLDIAIFSKVWHEIISWGIWWRRSSSIFPLSEFSLGGSGVGESILDISIDAEIWHLIIVLESNLWSSW